MNEDAPAIETRPFVKFANEILPDRNLSWKAKGIAIFLFRLGKESSTTKNIEEHSKESRDAVRSALRELEVHGYFERVQPNGGSGFEPSHWRRL